MKREIKRPHYAWIVLLSCCIMSGTTLGMISNCKGIFFAPVCQELGCSIADLTFYSTFYGISASVMLLWVSQIFRKFPIRLVLTSALLVFCGATASMGTFYSLHSFYIAGAIQGVSSAFLLFVPVPMLINNWFVERKGFALGISAMTSSLTGAVMNPAFNAAITMFGWRNTYILQGAMAFLLAVPFTSLLMVKKPQDRGLLSYGATAAKDDGKAAERQNNGRVRLTAVLICFCFAMIVTFCTGYIQHFSYYAASEGISSQIGATMVTAAMLGGIVTKLISGAASDRWGTQKVCLISLLFTICGLLLLILGKKNFLLLFAGASLVGIDQANVSIMIPLVVAGIAPGAAYDRIMAKVTMGTTFAGAFSTTAIGMLYDEIGSYQGTFLLGCFLLLLAMGLTVWIFALKKGAKA